MAVLLLTITICVVAVYSEAFNPNETTPNASHENLRKICPPEQCFLAGYGHEAFDKEDDCVCEYESYDGFMESNSGLPQHQTSMLLDDMMSKYDVRLRPSFGGEAVTISVTMWIDTIGPISEADMDFKTTFYFRQYWSDERLRFNASNAMDISLNMDIKGQLWIPDTFFPQDKHSFVHDVTKQNSLLRISPNGDVLYSVRVTVQANCPMDLSYFPMDVQKCRLNIESFGYTVKDSIYRWKEIEGEEAVDQNENIHINQFQLAAVTREEIFIILSTGNYSRLNVDFILRRSLGYFLIQTYFPAMLIVVISWVSFWICRKAVPARASLGITTVLTMITIMNGANDTLPKISYIKALDVYMVVCFIYVFTAMLEFAVVCFQDQEQGISPPHKNSLESLHETATQSEMKRLSSAGANNIISDRRRPSRWLTKLRTKPVPSRFDIYARCLFPLTFTLFNGLYWGIYLSITWNLIEELQMKPHLGKAAT